MTMMTRTRATSRSGSTKSEFEFGSDIASEQEEVDSATAADPQLTATRKRPLVEEEEVGYSKQTDCVNSYYEEEEEKEEEEEEEEEAGILPDMLRELPSKRAKKRRRVKSS